MTAATRAMLERMRHARILLLLTIGLAGACRDESPSGTAAGPAASPAASPGQALGAGRWVRLSPTAGALGAQLAAHAARASAQGARPVLYVGAVWCQPCKALAAVRDRPPVARAFRDIYTIELDLDDWSFAGLSALGYEVQAVPVFFEVGADGRAAGRKLDGGAWGGASAEGMAAAFERFFHGPAAVAP
jgi:hypothetical protein